MVKSELRNIKEIREQIKIQKAKRDSKPFKQIFSWNDVFFAKVEALEWAIKLKEELF